MELPQQRPHQNILNLFEAAKDQPHGFLCVSAPMVRYSKLEFRKLVRQHKVQLSFTPMIIADSFNNSEKARQNEFTTALDDQPVIAQFAAKNANEFCDAAQLIYPYVDGIDLNCGCPQSWAIAKGYGCGLLRQPELMRDIVQRVRRTLPHDFSISVKIRLLGGSGKLVGERDCVSATVELARQLEHCGVTFLTLHGRTANQKRAEEALNVSAMSDVKSSIGNMPLVVNGSVRTWQDACRLYKQTKADGVMAARGLLANPALFNPETGGEAAQQQTPIECVQQWLDIAASAGERISFQCFHHHLIFMWSAQMKRQHRIEFNTLRKKSDIYEFLDTHYDLRPSETALFTEFSNTECTYAHYIPPTLTRSKRNEAALEQLNESWNSNSDGKYFTTFQEQTAGTGIDEEQQQQEESNKDDVELVGSFFEDLS